MKNNKAIFFTVSLFLACAVQAGSFGIRGVTLGMTADEVVTQIKEKYQNSKLVAYKCAFFNRALPHQAVSSIFYDVASDRQAIGWSYGCKEEFLESEIKKLALNQDYGEEITDGAVVNKLSTVKSTYDADNLTNPERNGVEDEINVGFAFPPNKAEAMFISRSISYTGNTRPLKVVILKAMNEKFGSPSFVHPEHDQYFWLVDHDGNIVDRSGEEFSHDWCRRTLDETPYHVAKRYDDLVNRLGRERFEESCGDNKLALYVSFYAEPDTGLIKYMEYILVDLGLSEKIKNTQTSIEKFGQKYIDNVNEQAIEDAKENPIEL